MPIPSAVVVPPAKTNAPVELKRARSIAEKLEFVEVFLKIILLFVPVVFPKLSITIPLFTPTEPSWELTPFKIIAGALASAKTSLGVHPAPLVIVVVPIPKLPLEFNVKLVAGALPLKLYAVPLVPPLSVPVKARLVPVAAPSAGVTRVGVLSSTILPVPVTALVSVTPP